MQRWFRGTGLRLAIGVAGAIVAFGGLGSAQAQVGGKLAAAAPVTYDNRWEIFGGPELPELPGWAGVAEAHEHGRRGD